MARVHEAPPRSECRACLMLFCTPCQNLNAQKGTEYDAHHCQEHCEHKEEHSEIEIAKGVDKRWQKR